MKTKNLDFFVPVVAVMIVILIRPISIYHWVEAYPTELLEIDDETDSMSSWRIDDAMIDKENENDLIRREQALENLQKIFGIRGQVENKSTRNKIPPQFMMELYNTIADSSGVTRGKNPYNAKVVRSFIERDTMFSHLYLFNISGLEINESVIEAELHLYRKRTSVKAVHPSILTSPYHLIRVYQVLEGKSLDEPDLHRLLNVHYVGAHASGWQVFNVKQAVLEWVSGAPNSGLMVTSSNLFDDKVTVEFSRRNEYHNSKQPILVLFDDDRKEPTLKSDKIMPHYYTYDKRPEDMEFGAYEPEPTEDEDISDEEEQEESGSFQRQKRHRESIEGFDLQNRSKMELNKEHSYGTQLGNEKPGERGYFQREKRIEGGQEDDREDFIDAASINEKNDDPNEIYVEGRRNEKSEDFSMRQRRDANRIDGIFVAKRRSSREMVTSMDIYERAMSRHRTSKKTANSGLDDEQDRRDRRDRRSIGTTEKDDEKSKSYANTRHNTTECARHELYVDFKEIGLSSSIIAPKGYSAYHCRGLCDSPLSQDQQPTNHATVQGIVHKMGLVPDVHMPCCVPTKLVSTTILFFDDNENVVLKVYEDMIADRCGCR